eukprot:13622330-Heterocapsa_arctica.AAC.1
MVAASRQAWVCSKPMSLKARLPGRPVQVKASGPMAGRGVKVMGKQASNRGKPLLAPKGWRERS